MSQLRPRSMSQGAFAELLREHGFTACSKAAVSLAERPKESGVQFTPQARKAAQGLLKSPRRQENRVNGNKTTVWFDDETRAWLEKEAYLTEMGIEIDVVLDLEVADDKIVKRMSGRRVCLKCGASYHTEYKRPSKEGVCDVCGDALSIRKDDAPEVVESRLKVYHEETEPLKDYYADMGILREVQGQEELADTTALTLAALGIKD